MKINILCIFLIIPYLIIGQTFGDFDKNIINNTSDSLVDNAILLHHSCKVSYNFNDNSTDLILEYFQRIKVLNKSGIKHSNIEIPFYVGGSSEEDIIYIKAISYNNINGKIIETKLNKKDIYTETLNKNYKVKKLALPKVKEGTIIEVKYIKRTPYLYTIPTFYFQNEIPTKYAELLINVPKYMNFTTIPSGFLEIESSNRELQYSDHGEREFVFSSKDIPALKEDVFSLNSNDNRSGVKFEIETTNFPGRGTETYSKNWSSIIWNLNNNREFGYQLTRRLNGLEEIISEAKKLSEEERIQFCYDYVRENYTWDKKYARMSVKGLKKTIEEKVGNCADINILLTNLLNKCGVTAYPLLTRTRHSGMLNADRPSLSNINYMITYVEKENGTYILLDGTAKYIPLGQLPLRAINISGIIAKNKEAQILYVANPNKFSTRLKIKYKFDINNEFLVGEGTKSYKNYASSFYRNKWKKTEDGKDYQIDYSIVDHKDQEDINEEDGDYTQAKLIEGLNDIYEPLKVEINEKNTSSITKIGDEIFVDATFGYGTNENPFTEEKRNQPIFYNYSLNLNRSIVLEIPEGYKVKSIPDQLSISLNTKKASIIHAIIENQNKIIVNMKFKVIDPIILPEEYEEFKALYDSYLERSNLKIVLEKK